MTNNEKIDALQSCLGASRGQCDERGQKHWDWLEEFRLQLAHDPGTRPEPAVRSGVPFTRSAFHENRRSKWVTFNVRAEHADAAEAALNVAPPAAMRDALQHAEKWREFNGERPAPAAEDDK